MGKHDAQNVKILTFRPVFSLPTETTSTMTQTGLSTKKKTSTTTQKIANNKNDQSRMFNDKSNDNRKIN